MSISPRLSRKLHDGLGAEAAEDLVTWMDETRSQHTELRADLAELRQEMKAGFARIELQILGGVETRLGGVETRLGGVETRLGDRIHALEVKVHERSADLIKWSFVFWVGAVIAIAALAGVLR